MYNINFLKSFYNDFDEIVEYIFRMTFSNDIINNFTNEIYEKTIYLKLFPNMYQNTYKDFRTIQIKSYKIFYKVDEIKKEVTIYRLLGASRNFREYI